MGEILWKVKMNRKDIIKATNRRDGILLKCRDGRTAKLRFVDFERLRFASKEERRNYVMSQRGFRWEGLDEDISYDSVFNPKDFPLKMKSCAEYLNMSAVARRLKIQQSLLAAYMSGKKTPSEARRKEICSTILDIAEYLRKNFRDAPKKFTEL